MRASSKWIPAIVVIAVVTGAAQAQLRLLPDAGTQAVFGGERRTVELRWHNAGREATNADVSVRLLQASSATAMSLGQWPWKNLTIQPGQTVLEIASLDFPVVRAKTRCLVQLLVGTSQVLGTTEVFVFPTNLLVQLKTLAGDEPLGVFDPANELKPLLRTLAIEFADMQEQGTDKYHGKLAIFGPFGSRTQMRASLKEDIRALARRGVAVVWLQPPPDKFASLKPSFYAVSEGEGTIVVAAHELVAGLAGRPDAQLNLLLLAEHSLHPTAPALPETETSN